MGAIVAIIVSIIAGVSGAIMIFSLANALICIFKLRSNKKVDVAECKYRLFKAKQFLCYSATSLIVSIVVYGIAIS